MVGDRVNTASRVQSVAEPGTVYVDEVTRQVTAAAIAYADAGEHAVKGKSEPLHLWRALRVVAGVAGSQREGGSEGPLVGPRLRAAADQGALPLRGGARGGAVGRDIGPGGRRQDATALGVREVHRRPRGHRALALRPLPGLRRGRRLLGARRDGAPAPGDRRGGGARGVRAAVGIGAGAVDPRPHGPRVPRSPPGRAHRDDRGLPGPPGAVRGLAALLRASGRAGTGGHGLRRPPVGRRRAAGLHRAPAGVVGRQADLHRGARALRARRAPGGLAARPRRGHAGLPGAAGRRGGGLPPRRAGRRPPRDRTPAHRLPGRGDPALRPGDGARPRRPGRARRGRRAPGRHRGRGRDRDAGHAELPADRPDGRAGPRGAGPGQGPGGDGRQLPARDGERPLRPARRAGRRAAGIAGPQAGPGGPRRPPLARARALRLRAEHAPDGRLRHALQARAQATPPGDRRSSAQRLPERGRGARRGDRLPLPGRLPRRAGGR